MFKLLMLTAAAFLAAPAAATGAPPSDARSGASEDLRHALHDMMDATKATPPGQDKRPDDPDQGDDNASLRAITEVCTKDTPAADRSAICDRAPVSPH